MIFRSNTVKSIPIMPEQCSFFISSQDPDAKVVKPHSPMTHPTYSARNFELEKVNS